ncbi:hypothetical protein D3C78_635070 [compost metagenome]
MQRIHGFSLAANLEVQLHPVGPCRAHFGNVLPDFDLLPFPHQQPAVVTVGAHVGITVLDDHEFAVAPQTTTGVHNRTIRRSQNRLAQLSGYINPFIQTSV